MDASAEQTQARIAVVLSCQQIPMKLLSAYGSELGQTPHFDRMASRGIVFDQHFAEDLSESPSRHAWWDGTIAANAESSADQPTLSMIAHSAGVKCCLISHQTPTEWNLAPKGWETTYLENCSDSARERLAELYEIALQTITQLRNEQQSAIVWIHSDEMPSLPIPGMEFLELYLNELPQIVYQEEEIAETGSDEQEDEKAEDEESPDLREEERAAAFELIEETLSLMSEGVAVPEKVHIKTMNVLAAARLSEWDHALGEFYDRLRDDLDAGRALLLLTADRGLPLFESVVTQQLERSKLLGPLQEETMHLPLLMVRGQQALGQRIGALTQPADVPATLLDWLYVSHEFPIGRSLLPLVEGEVDTIHNYLICQAGEWDSVREPEWLLIRNREDGTEKLYIQPEDRWQVLDVLSQYIDEADRLIALLKQKTLP